MQPKAVTPHSTVQRSLRLKLASKPLKDDDANTRYKDDDVSNVPGTQMSPVSKNYFESSL